jgi:hypothetical protein
MSPAAVRDWVQLLVNSISTDQDQEHDAVGSVQLTTIIFYEVNLWHFWCPA